MIWSGKARRVFEGMVIFVLLCVFFVCLFKTFKTVSHSVTSLAWTAICVAQDSPELMVFLLSQVPKCRNDRHEALHPTRS